ncbi:MULTISPECIES: hypothetical protein [unclassified Methylobacterium]|uniref:hypothetical protein n=1 Tax=unclassified Methylobacterium TaxID=2615210 RepID=UPI001F48682B|nr:MULTISPECIES: hypothetical protein [Methylobacterium]WFT78036.1 hypothetical protein QA634_22420 [Methylobacterium nodulans]
MTRTDGTDRDFDRESDRAGAAGRDRQPPRGRPEGAGRPADAPPPAAKEAIARATAALGDEEDGR